MYSYKKRQISYVKNRNNITGPANKSKKDTQITTANHINKFVQRISITPTCARAKNNGCKSDSADVCNIVYPIPKRK